MTIDAISAFSGVGILFALVFLLDAWKPSPPDVPLVKNPRTAGLVYFLSGGAVASVAELLGVQKGSDPLVHYVFFFVAATLVGLVVSTTIITLIWFLHFKEKMSPSLILAAALSSCVHSLYAGLVTYREDISAEDSRLRAEHTQLDERQLIASVAVFRSTYDQLIEISEGMTLPAKPINLFIKDQLLASLLAFFHGGQAIDRFRAAFYRYDPALDNLVFEAGWPEPGSYRGFSGQPLSVQGSLAGLCFQKHLPKFYPDNKDEQFESRSSARPYASFVIVPVPSFNSASPIGVLTVDYAETTHPFQSDVGLALISGMADAIYQIVMVYRRHEERLTAAGSDAYNDSNRGE